MCACRGWVHKEIFSLEEALHSASRLAPVHPDFRSRLVFTFPKPCPTKAMAEMLDVSEERGRWLCVWVGVGELDLGRHPGLGFGAAGQGVLAHTGVDRARAPPARPRMTTHARTCHLHIMATKSLDFP